MNDFRAGYARALLDINGLRTDAEDPLDYIEGYDFAMRYDAQVKCKPGNKPCGKTCIPMKEKCRIKGEGGGMGLAAKAGIGLAGAAGLAGTGYLVANSEPVKKAIKGVKRGLKKTARRYRDTQKDIQSIVDNPDNPEVAAAKVIARNEEKLNRFKRMRERKMEKK